MRRFVGGEERAIEGLWFLGEVDERLRRGEPAEMVAEYVVGMGALVDVERHRLVSALRRRQVRLAGKSAVEAGMHRRWVGAAGDGVVVKGKVGRQAGEGLDELVELESLYRCVRDRLERLLALEEESGRYMSQLSRDIQAASELLAKRFEMRERLGMVDGCGRDGAAERARELADAGYSGRTVEVLSNPESRHRVVALVERLARVGGVGSGFGGGSDGEGGCAGG